MINIKRIGCPGCQSMQGPARNLRMRGVGWRPLRGYRSLHGLGQDSADGGFDGGGDFSSFDGGAGFDTGGGLPPDTIVTSGPSTDIPVIEPAATPTPLPYVDATTGLPPGSTIDQETNFITLPDGSTIGSAGTITMANGTVIFTDQNGNTAYTMTPDGTIVDAYGNVVPGDTPAAQALQQQAAASGGGGSSGGGKGSGGGGSSQSSLQQLLCAFNPRASGCPGAGTTAAAGTRRTTTGSITSSFSSWWNQYWPWVVGGGVAVIVGPMLLDALTDSGGGRRR